FASYGRLKHRTDECLSTTLYPKESGLTVSFNFLHNPCQRWRGFLLPNGRLKHRTDECLSTTLYPKESGLTVSFNFLHNPCQ
ncbi:hypothetical protein, partial [Klebsiella sp. DNRA6]|uniref:hypothetical protein n=1 Tax=Klebsiella sp. DNRA6 TaxID=2723057 RepID=UPI001B7D0034